MQADIAKERERERERARTRAWHTFEAHTGVATLSSTTPIIPPGKLHRTKAVNIVVGISRSDDVRSTSTSLRKISDVLSIRRAREKIGCEESLCETSSLSYSPFDPSLPRFPRLLPPPPQHFLSHYVFSIWDCFVVRRKYSYINGKVFFSRVECIKV